MRRLPDPETRAAAQGSVKMERSGGVAIVSLFEPGYPGRMDASMDSQLCRTIEELAFDDTVRVVLLVSRSRDFCLGLAPDEGDGLVQSVEAVAQLSCPVIAVVHGGAVAEGCELALACDLRFASRRAYFALPQLTEGRFFRNGATQRLPRLVGRPRALEMLWTGQRVAAAKALRWGLVNAVWDEGALRSEAERYARLLAQRAPLALRYAKEAVGKGLDGTLEQGMRLEEDLYVLLQTTADWRAGIEAFRRKKKVRFRGQ
ncbi:MAG: crotonase [Candidatus Binatia bacterium]|nr:MAG: crotonase [Candidatus Binatia bacterium]